MPVFEHLRRRRVVTSVASAALLAALSIATPMAASAAVDDNGGAARNDSDQTEALRNSIVNSDAKNVIVLIGDGMGDSEITVARNYAEGAAGTLSGIDALPLTGQYTTWALNKDGTPNYASESASTASGWSTGTKTNNGALSVDIHGEAQDTLIELAKANGLKTGNVSTAEIQDATPGAEIAHVSARGCYGPTATTKTCPEAALENGGLGSISEQLLNVRPDVTLGGGSKTFNETAVAGPWKGKTLFEQADERGYQLVNDAAGLDAVTAASADEPVLGLFTEGNFPVRWLGPEATAGGGDLPAVSCTENPDRLDTGLSLGSLTDKAIDLLESDEQGFFLQVEGASIDKRDHAADACGQIGETVDLDEAVQVALDFAKADGDTLVVVTADHAHTSQIVGSTPPGLSAHLLTEEGQSMIVAYGTSEAGGSQQHTGAQVRIAGYGPGAANVVGLTDQTDLFFTSANALSLNRDLASLSADATVSVDKAEVAPGGTVAVTVSGLDADWQASGLLGSVELGQRDVLRGTTTFTVEAPTTLGAHEVTLTGAQTATALTASFVVTEDPAAVPVPTPTDEPGDGGGAGAGAGGGPGGLASTGASVAPFAALAALLLAAGAMLLKRHRARQQQLVL